MRRAVILATLTILLLAVAGVTAAREDTLVPTSEGEPQTESTAPESTMPESPEDETVESTVPETTPPEVTVAEDTEEATEEATTEVTAVSEGVTPAEEDPDEVSKDEDNEEAGRPVVKPDKPEKPVKMGPRGGKERGVGRPDDAGKAGKRKSGGNPGKVTICHKDRVTISVGAPAEPAHLRHGDSLGAC